MEVDTLTVNLDAIDALEMLRLTAGEMSSSEIIGAFRKMVGDEQLKKYSGSQVMAIMKRVRTMMVDAMNPKEME